MKHTQKQSAAAVPVPLSHSAPLSQPATSSSTAQHSTQRQSERGGTIRPHSDTLTHAHTAAPAAVAAVLSLPRPHSSSSSSSDRAPADLTDTSCIPHSHPRHSLRPPPLISIHPIPCHTPHPPFHHLIRLSLCRPCTSLLTLLRSTSLRPLPGSPQPRSISAKLLVRLRLPPSLSLSRLSRPRLRLSFVVHSERAAPLSAHRVCAMPAASTVGSVTAAG